FIVGAALLSLAGIRPAESQLDYDMHSTETGSRFVIVKVSFDHEDDLSKFKDLRRKLPRIHGSEKGLSPFQFLHEYFAC
ncbi:hypothetical protein ACCT04_36840, partial [Rhizobium ruizarguesonis]